MSTTSVRDGLGAFLVGPYDATQRAFLPAVVGVPPVAGLWIARRGWQKDDDRRDFTRDAPAGTKTGALMVIHLDGGEEKRISVPAVLGRKQVRHRVTLYCYVRSTQPYAEDASDDAYALKDAIFTKLRTDPTCASGGFEAGGFQIGEGGDPWLRWFMTTPETSAELTMIFL